jgi:hypothetical protein
VMNALSHDTWEDLRAAFHDARDDEAVRGVMGQNLQWHVGRGADGIKHFMDHLREPLAGMKKVLGTPNITPQLKQTIVDGVLRETAGRSVAQLAKKENEVISGPLRLRASAENGESGGTAR